MQTIVVYVRHSADCPHRDNEFFRGCDCRKHLRWHSNGKRFRQSAKTRKWPEAEQLRKRMEASLRGGPAPNQDAKAIDSAIESFISSKESNQLSVPLIKKYRRELGRLRQFLADRKKHSVSQINLDDLIAYRANWHVIYKAATTRQMVQQRLAGFLRYCYDAGHIDRVPRLSPIKSKAAPTMPLTDTQYNALLAAIPKLSEDQERKTKLHALVRLMRHSGLAIRDAVTLERGEIILDDKKKIHRIVTARQKTGTHVSVPIPPDVAKELLEVLNGNPRYVFWSGTGREEASVNRWHHFMRRIFDLAGMPNGHSHQLRDTFARDLLEKGVPIPEVSKALGHESIRTTERSYAAWVPERQDRLDTLVTGTWGK